MAKPPWSSQQTAKSIDPNSCGCKESKYLENLRNRHCVQGPLWQSHRFNSAETSNLMNPNTQYFTRNQGEWNWRIDFRVVNWMGLWTAPTSLMNKVRIVLFVLSQTFVGSFRMWTQVVVGESKSTVFHRTRIAKWGIRFMESKKTFLLDPDGTSLKLTGFEFYWPRLNVAIPFAEMRGRVDECSTRAFYEMPIFGMKSDCRTVLEPSDGHIELDLGWLKVRFHLTESSMKDLRSRFSVEFGWLENWMGRQDCCSLPARNPSLRSGLARPSSLPATRVEPLRFSSCLTN